MANMFALIAKAKQAAQEAQQTDAYKDSVAAKQAMGWDAGKNQELRSNISSAYDQAYQKAYKGLSMNPTIQRDQAKKLAAKAADKAKASAMQQWQSYAGQYKPNESQVAQATTERQLRDMGNQTMDLAFDRSEQDRAARDQYLQQQQTGFGALSDALKQYQDIASGRGPSVAGQRYAQSRDDIMRNQMSLASMGGAGGALAAGQASQQFANIAPQLAQGAAIARSQEQLGALGAQSQVAGQMLGQQLAGAQLMQQGELGYQGYGAGGMNFLQGQQQSLLDQDYRKRTLEQQYAIAKMEADMQKRQQNLGIFASIIGAAGGAGAAALGKPGG